MDFQERFATEEACLEYLAASRWPEGFRCPGCEGRDAWVLERRHLWECASCHRQTSVTAGTVMHRPARRFGSGSGPPTWSPPTIREFQPSSFSASSASATRRRG